MDGGSRVKHCMNYPADCAFGKRRCRRINLVSAPEFGFSPKTNVANGLMNKFSEWIHVKILN